MCQRAIEWGFLLLLGVMIGVALGMYLCRRIDILPWQTRIADRPAEAVIIMNEFMPFGWPRGLEKKVKGSLYAIIYLPKLGQVRYAVGKKPSGALDISDDWGLHQARFVLEARFPKDPVVKGRREREFFFRLWRNIVNQGIINIPEAVTPLKGVIDEGTHTVYWILLIDKKGRIWGRRLRVYLLTRELQQFGERYGSIRKEMMNWFASYP